MSNLNYLTWDTETSGINVENDEVLTCFMRDSAGKEYSWILDHGIDIPVGAAEVHGMDRAWLAEHGRKDVAVALQEIVSTLETYVDDGFVLVGYNVAFDFQILKNSASRHNIWFLPEHTRVIDPHILDKHVDPYRKGGRKLVDVARHYGVDVDETKLHEARYDVLLTEQLIRPVLNEVWRKEKPLQGLTKTEIVDKLQVMQAKWKIQQAESLQAYFDKTGKRNEDGSKIVVSTVFKW